MGGGVSVKPPENREHLVACNLSSIVIVLVTMIGICVSMRMGVSGAVAVAMFVLVEDDLQAASKCVRDPAQRRQTWHMIAPLKTGDHRLGHLYTFGELLLRLAGMFAEFEKPAGALRGDGCAIVKTRAWSKILL